MAAQKPLQLDSNGNLAEVAANQSSAGSGDAGKIVALNAAGQIDNTMLADSVAISIVASENIAAGALINVWSNSGTLNIRNADNTSASKEADGFAPAAITASASGTVILTNGVISGLTGLTIGTMYFLSTVGAITGTLPTGTGVIVQKVGRALSTTSLAFMPEVPVTRA